MPLCPPQTPHAVLTRTRTAAVGSQRLTAWATALLTTRYHIPEERSYVITTVRTSNPTILYYLNRLPVCCNIPISCRIRDFIQDFLPINRLRALICESYLPTTEFCEGENLSQRHVVHHKSHMTRPGWIRAAAVGSQRLTVWAMARPFLKQAYMYKLLQVSKLRGFATYWKVSR
jgi:hypothetical protein